MEDNGDLAPIVIDLTVAESGEMNKSFLSMFGGGIKRCCWFVQNQDWCVADDGSGDRKTLTLTRG